MFGEDNFLHTWSSKQTFKLAIQLSAHIAVIEFALIGDEESKSQETIFLLLNYVLFCKHKERKTGSKDNLLCFNKKKPGAKTVYR